ncbi:MAG: PhzF family phenazine biosynthesis protein [Defluviitaleaceae bacterium]|nr:PhzF family phenazine biosynthesis protein [Defluviitaleaceae bacterium]
MIKYFEVNAFTTGDPFSGNPAGVCLLDEWLNDTALQNIAAQNNLSETAYVIPGALPVEFALRWFTPMTEVDLCGHATLAAAHVVMSLEGDLRQVTFNTCSGQLNVSKQDNLYTLDFPSRKPVSIAVLPSYENAVGAKVTAAYASRDLILMLESEDAVRSLKPDMELLSKIPDFLGVCVTAKSNEDDFVSRFFAPLEGIPEDPVTGSAHCNLTPLWDEILCKNGGKMIARQLSRRGGKLLVTNNGERVGLTGAAELYLTGQINIIGEESKYGY